MKKIFQFWLLIFVLFIIAVFFRFYRFFDFQYWSVDDGILFLSARKIFIEHKPILLIPNTTVEISLAPFFVYISSFFFWITNSNLFFVLAIGSLFGVITSLAIYQAGRLLGGIRVGLIAFFLYSSSFLLALFDRRWWQLSLDPLLTILAIIALYKIINKKYYFALLLSICLSFAWNADPSLLVIAVAAFFCFLLFKLPLFKYQYIPALFWIFISLSPFFIAEIRHPKSVSHPIDLYFSRIFEIGNVNNKNFKFSSVDLFIEIAENLNRSIFTSPSTHADDNFFCVANYPSSLFSPYSVFISLFLFTIPVIWILQNKKKKLRKNILLLYIFIGSFLLSILIFNLLAKVGIHQSYFLGIWPVFLLLLAFGLEFLLVKGLKLLVYSFLLLILYINLYTLHTSKIDYPLKTKLKVVDTAIENMNDKPFALHYEGIKYGFTGGGWESLFTIRGKPPAWGTVSNMTKWIYEAYSLYPTKPQKEKDLKQKVNLFAPDVVEFPKNLETAKKMEVEEIKIFIQN